MTQLRAIDFACNDPDNGLFAFSVSAAKIGDDELERDRACRFTEIDGGIRIHHRVFKVVQSREWVGNWCWNRYWLEEAEFQSLLSTMRDNGWRCTCGAPATHRFFDGGEAA